MKPRIGILTSLDRVEEQGRFCLNTNYLEAIVEAGGLPFLIPAVSRPEVYLSQVDGILLPGGADLDPVLYGQEPDRKLGRIEPALDLAEQALLKVALSQKLPLLGICRGMQALVVAQGGTLYQDLSLQGTTLSHRQIVPGNHPWHSINIEEGSILAEFLGEKARVNSFHHQGAQKLVGLRPIAKSPDGVIEAVAGEGFVLGVQWHPERMYREEPGQLAIFKGLVEAAKSGV